MTYEDFIEMVPALLQKRLGEEARICIHTIYKNNSVKKEALCILEEGGNVSPTIYLRPYYERLTGGRPLEEILSEMEEEYQANRCGLYVDAGEFQSFEKMRPWIAYRLVNYEKNRELLAKIPHRRFLDLAVIYYLLIENHFIGSGTALIYHTLSELWGVGEETLFETACANTDRLLGYEITPMDFLIEDLLQKDLMRELGENPAGCGYAKEDVDTLARQILDSLASGEPSGMYVMSNASKYYGAAALMNTKGLCDFAREKESNFYVIPSSVHEAILAPVQDSLSREELATLLGEINMAEEGGQEFLSGQVYYFDREKGSLEI